MNTTGRSFAAKRGFDALVSVTVLLGLSPLIMAVAVAIKLESRGPVFYRSIRVGQSGRELRMLKFRKMHADATGSALTVASDERFTRLGRWLARTKIDEIPQFWNVVAGDMSLIGPRPEDPGFVALAPKSFAIPLLVKPGITGLSQLAFVRESEILDPQNRERDYVERILPQKLTLDSLYAQRSTFAMDLAILRWTFACTLLRADVAVSRASGRLSRRAPRKAEIVGAATGHEITVAGLETGTEAEA